MDSARPVVSVAAGITCFAPLTVPQTFIVNDWLALKHCSTAALIVEYGLALVPRWSEDGAALIVSELYVPPEVETQREAPIAEVFA